MNKKQKKMEGKEFQEDWAGAGPITRHRPSSHRQTQQQLRLLLPLLSQQAIFSPAAKTQTSYGRFSQFKTQFSQSSSSSSSSFPFSLFFRLTNCPACCYFHGQALPKLAGEEKQGKEGHFGRNTSDCMERLLIESNIFLFLSWREEDDDGVLFKLKFKPRFIDTLRHDLFR